MASEDPSGRRARQRKPGGPEPQDRDVRFLVLFLLVWCLAVTALAAAYLLLI